MEHHAFGTTSGVVSHRERLTCQHRVKAVRTGPADEPTTNRAAAALRMAAQSLSNSKSVLGAFYRKKRYHLGTPKAITATAHKLAKILYALLNQGGTY